MRCPIRAYLPGKTAAAAAAAADSRGRGRFVRECEGSVYHIMLLKPLHKDPKIGSFVLACIVGEQEEAKKLRIQTYALKT